MKFLAATVLALTSAFAFANTPEIPPGEECNVYLKAANDKYVPIHAAMILESTYRIENEMNAYILIEADDGTRNLKIEIRAATPESAKNTAKHVAELAAHCRKILL